MARSARLAWNRALRVARGAAALQERTGGSGSASGFLVHNATAEAGVNAAAALDRESKRYSLLMLTTESRR